MASCWSASSEGPGGEEVVTEVATFRSDGVLLRWPPPGCRALHHQPGRGCKAPRLHHQWHDDGPRRNGTRCWIMVGGRQDLKCRLDTRHWRCRPSALAKTNCACCAGCALAARFVFALEPATASAIEQPSACGKPGELRERIRDELTRMLTEGRAHPAFELLDATGLAGCRCCLKWPG